MTEFAETAVLLAALEGDREAIVAKLADFMMSEVFSLAAAADMVTEECDRERLRRMTPNERNDLLWSRLAP